MNWKPLFMLLGVAGMFTLIPLSGTAALADSVSPDDSTSAGAAAPSNPQINPTGLFALGEVDLSSLGASPTDLLGVGPTASTSDPGGNLIVEPFGSTECPNAQYNSIQAAVDAASPGATIKVCAGTYTEQVTIPSGKDDLTLHSVPDLQAIIQAPAVMTSPKAIVRVNGAQNTTIRHFTIEGPGGGPCDSIEEGVRVDNGGSALITDNHISKIQDSPFSGCQNGIGVRIGRNFDGTYGSATIVHNLIDNYQKGGIVVDGQLATGAPVSHAEVAYNQVQGVGPTPLIAQNGIQVSRGAVANVHNNTVTGNAYAPKTVTSVGILLFEDSSPDTQVSHNDASANDEGIGLYTTTNTTISHNNAHDNLSGDGLFADSDTASNVISYNRFENNTPFDCEDASTGTNNPPANVANLWVKDFGDTESRPGLCKHATA
ncbi:MAG TPA: right-handed parallel beta-helix repeat-containing protein [Candidatus Dormibacteraeota bacterium]